MFQVKTRGIHSELGIWNLGPVDLETLGFGNLETWELLLIGGLD